MEASMPAQYTAIKESLLHQGKPKKEAERIAAATFIGHSKDHHKAALLLMKDRKGIHNQHHPLHPYHQNR